MTTREPTPSSNPRVRLWRVRNDAGQEIGTDEETILTTAEVSETTLRGRVATALTTNATYLALPMPRTNAQMATQIEALTRQNIALGRLVAGLLDATDGT